MGEAILTRTTTIPDEILNPINPVPGACILNFKVVDSDNKPVGGMPVTCKDGSLTYTYNTNDTGIVRFTTNSGQCNLTFSNTLNNKVRVLDHALHTHNMYEAPVGTVVNDTIKLNYLSSATIDSGQSGNAIFLTSKFADLNLGAGGGGGGGAVNGQLRWGSDEGWESVHLSGGGGGRGQGTHHNNIAVEINHVYSYYSGKGGKGGSWAMSTEYATTSGGTGGTGGSSYFGSYSCIGGGGGTGGKARWESWNASKQNGSPGASYTGGGYGGSAGTCKSSVGSWSAFSAGDGGPGWLRITMRK